MDLCLLPVPAKLKIEHGFLSLKDPQIILPASPSDDTLFAASQLQQAITKYASVNAALAAGISSSASPIRLTIDRPIGSAQAYELAIRHDGIALVGADEAGLFYAVQTLIQILRQSRNHLPLLQIVDAPLFADRGVMLDISRDKVPTLQTVFEMVDQFAEWKLNQLQLYMEHTFAYSQHREVWAQASPFTAEDVLKLDAYCRQRHIQLVPNQNSFGHMERWLRLPRYLDLAEAPEGSDTPWNSRWDGPFSLCPTDPRAIELLRGLYAELLPNFSSRLFNVGCDETFDIGQGRSKAAADARGKTRVYLDFLLDLQKLVQANGRTMMFWGDIILHQPQLISELPRNIIAMEWGYEADHPFEKNGPHFAKAGVPFYMCPGTSSWNSIAGRTDNALANLISAAEAGRKHGAIGYLNTDWGDFGHIQYLPISYLGFAAGAAYSWNIDSNRKLDIKRALDLHVFHDSANVMGKLAYDLGNVYQHLKVPSNSSRLFWLLVATKSRSTDDIEMKQLEAALAGIHQTTASLNAARMDRPDAALIKREFANAAAMLTHAARHGKWLLDKKSVTPLDLTSELRAIIGEHESLWLSRNRPGGLVDSANRLRETLATYEAK